MSAIFCSPFIGRALAIGEKHATGSSVAQARGGGVAARIPRILLHVIHLSDITAQSAQTDKEASQFVTLFLFFCRHESIVQLPWRRLPGRTLCTIRTIDQSGFHFVKAWRVYISSVRILLKTTEGFRLNMYFVLWWEFHRFLFCKKKTVLYMTIFFKSCLLTFFDTHN